MTTENNDGRHVKEISPLEITNDDLAPNEQNNDNPSSTIEEQYHSEREQTKLRHWKESEYAAGLVETSWAEELETYRKGGGCCCCPNREALGQMFQEEIDPGCGCIFLSAVICSRLGAGRIGNMAILKERYVMVEVEDDGEDDEGQEQVDGFVDEEEGLSLHQRNKSSDNDSNNSAKKTKTKLVRKREIQLVVGPFWPMLLFITYPLIFGVSALTLWNGIPGKPWYVQIGWALMTGQLIRSLFNTGFRDPGMIQRHENPPPVNNDGDLDGEDRSRRRIGFRWGNEEGPWRWSDQAQSYRPKNSMYCPDCKVVIEEFDHTCPWTGTAIGKKNMSSFQMFVGLVFVCLIMDIFLLTAGSMV
eukprot:CAMPEP_0201869132 /NCGR_PEP_ID=MMETSP0902-20130614/2757_1 /ASSEMBLY_ACC=CAM_ASM_000551 /TAXON_ID=420261 /ORGANISM="Thalassiosira antarctica, Strain CCMP982" /LENGTH=358 /DNA_ID=CAMNT_0048394581 /DNA_START=108 /DNA_END=1184 /DNA_ORIENTATION=+